MGFTVKEPTPLLKGELKSGRGQEGGTQPAPGTHPNLEPKPSPLLSAVQNSWAGSVSLHPGSEALPPLQADELSPGGGENGRTEGKWWKRTCIHGV